MFAQLIRVSISLLIIYFSAPNNLSAQWLDQRPAAQLTESSEYLETVQRATFRYFWDFGHPVSGLSPERTATPNIVTSGGTGFGVSCIVVAVHRGWISRQEAVTRLLKITRFLEKADRFHGAWSHWLDGKTGKVVPFGTHDNGGDLVETAYLINGLLVARAYFDQNTPVEKELRARITRLYETVEWTWYVRNGKLHWHWSPNYEWKMNMPIQGYNECLVTYALACGSPTYPVPTEVYENTWKQSYFFQNGKTFYGYRLDLGFDKGGPLFFSHYSYLSLDPRLMQDRHTNYWQQNVAHTLVNYEHCLQAPKEYGYSEENWGLTASDDFNFYAAHNPNEDNGTISPTAALSAFAYTPYQSWRALRYWYLKQGNRLFGQYGFYDAYNARLNWYSNQYLAIDQGPIVLMMENYRSGLIWNLGKKIPELWRGLAKMGITPPQYESGFPFYVPHPNGNPWPLLRHPDYAHYHVEFTTLGQEPVTLKLENAKNQQILVAQKNLADGIHQVFFQAEGGEYELVLQQGTTIKKQRVRLH
ncbi:MAG: beta-glucosidase [Spirosomaceae bacterium]|nr:beta-glucosidase [Spirosomataceae bacterium]